MSCGIALGGGGARGLAHIPLLAVLDELGIKPSVISGTSMGALIGAIYASGSPATDIRNFFDEVLSEPKSLTDIFNGNIKFNWIEYIDLDIGRSNILSMQKLLDEIERRFGISTFEALDIPLMVVAAEFWSRQEVIFDEGAVLPAIAASSAVPGIFKPIVKGERILIDGGVVNPVPYDLLQERCDFSVAIDVIGTRSSNGKNNPSMWELAFNTIQIAEKTILREKMKSRPPTIYIDVDLSDMQMLEFDKATEIYDMAVPAAKRLRSELERLLE